MTKTNRSKGNNPKPVHWNMSLVLELEARHIKRYSSSPSAGEPFEHIHMDIERRYNLKDQDYEPKDSN